MLAMVSYSRPPPSGQITCYLNRTYHVLLTDRRQQLAGVLPFGVEAVGDDAGRHSVPWQSPFIAPISRHCDNDVRRCSRTRCIICTSLVARWDPSNGLWRLHTSLAANTSPAQQFRFCASVSFGNSSGKVAPCIRSPCLVDDADAAEQVYLGTRYSGLRGWVLRRWSGVLEFSLTARESISPQLRAPQGFPCFRDQYPHVGRGRSPRRDPHSHCTGLHRAGTYYDAW